MKKLLLAIILMSTIITSKAQSNPDKAVAMLRSFYIAYMSEFSSYDLQQIERNLAALREKYCTKTCLRQYEKLGNARDVDPLINAQDSGKKFLKHLNIRKNRKKANLYTVTYTGDDIKETVTISLTVTYLNGVPKISTID